MAAVAFLVGDPARACMLAELLDGRALPAGHLARCAGVSPATASEHLAKLAEAHLVTCLPQGRHRYYRLSSPQVAAALESIAALALDAPPRQRATPRVPPEMQLARTCYNHIAGRLGVRIADALIASDALVLDTDGGELTAAGERLLTSWGAAAPARGRTGRIYCRTCIDWSERRPHLGGAVGALILDRSLQLGWVARAPRGRALRISSRGRSGFRKLFGVEI